MGFYYGSTRSRLSSENIGPMITPREYTSLFADAMRLMISRTPLESDIHRSALPGVAVTSGLIDGLSRQLRHRPDNPTIHRMLAIAHLHAGHYTPAIRHLTIAVNILLPRTTKSPLQQGLRPRVELALLLPVLVSLCLRLGRRATAHRLVSKLLLGLVRG